MTTKASRHRFHALCPYFAMFPESFAEKWIDKLTRSGDTVLDPFSGRGTTAFQALLMDRKAIASDVNPVAVCVSRAKVDAPRLSAIERRLDHLQRGFEPNRWRSVAHSLPEFFLRAYAPTTLFQLVYLREMLHWKSNKVDCMIGALVLGALHGESQRSDRYLSNQMPRTISTKPAYSIGFWRRHALTAPKRDVFKTLKRAAEFRYDSTVPRGEAKVYHADVRKLPRLLPPEERIRCVITSPPYFDLTDFEEDQWLRLWFLGGPAAPGKGRVKFDSRHRSQEGYWSFIADTWRVIGQITEKRSKVVFRIGSTKMPPQQLMRALTGASVFTKRKCQLIHHETSVISNRQTETFRPGSQGCRVELDCVYTLD